jgi:NitT/TauT family transport system substrate-binding protein
VLVAARRRRFVGSLVSIAAVSLALGACGSDDSSSSSASKSGSSTSEAPAEPTDITFSLDFLVDGLHAPFYSAQELGTYDKANLNVDIRTSTGSSDAVARVGSGKAQIGLADAPTALTGIGKGLPIKIVGVLLIHSAQATETLKSSNITDVKGLAGKDIGITPAGAERDLITALLQMNGMSPDDVHFVAIQAQSGKANLLSGKVDAVNFFPAIFADIQPQINVIPWFKYGLDIYGTTIIANTDFLEENPDAVTAFVHSSMEGLQYTLQNPDEAAAIVAKAAKGKPAFFRSELEIYEPYWSDPPLQQEGLGHMTDERWTDTQKVAMQYLGQKKEIPLDQLYTNDFLGEPVTP